jgi:hypothetical protein
MWYAVVEKATGRLHAVDTILADPMPVIFKVLELGEDFVEEGKKWDVPTQTFVHEEDWLEWRARLRAEAITRAGLAADDILAMSGISKLTVAQRTALKAKLLFYLSPKEA